MEAIRVRIECLRGVEGKQVIPKYEHICINSLLTHEHLRMDHKSYAVAHTK